MLKCLIFCIAICFAIIMTGCVSENLNRPKPPAITLDSRIMDVPINLNVTDAKFSEVVKQIEKEWEKALYPVIPPAIVIKGDDYNNGLYTFSMTGIPVMRCLLMLGEIRGAPLNMGKTYVKYEFYNACVSEEAVLPVKVPPKAQSVLGINSKTTNDELKKILVAVGIEFKESWLKATWNPHSEVIVICNYPEECRKLAGIVSLISAGYRLEKDAQQTEATHP